MSFNTNKALDSLESSQIRPIINHYIIQKDPTSGDVGSLHGGGLGIRTLATVTRPNDLANRPLQPLE